MYLDEKGDQKNHGGSSGDSSGMSYVSTVSFMRIYIHSTLRHAACVVEHAMEEKQACTTGKIPTS